MKYAILILTTIILTGIGFYFLLNETLAEKLESENQKILEEYAERQIDCYRTASLSGTSHEILKKYDECILRPKPTLITTVGDSGSGEILTGTHSTGITVPPSQITDKLSQLHKRVCEKQVNSPLCKDKALFDRLYHLTEERLPGKNFYPIMLGILNSESSLGTNFYPSGCSYTNNLAGKKWKKTDDGKSVRDQKIPDKNGCWLYSFESIEDFWISYTNTFRYGYKGCIDSKTPLACIAPMYVKGDGKPKPQWVKNASLFLD